MTQRLYYTDSYLTEFRGRVISHSADGRVVYLDQTAFYPASGGQPADRGAIGGVQVMDVVDEGDRIAHHLASAVPGPDVNGAIDWQRRFDFMQQHSGQHLLSAVLESVHGWKTVSVHFGDEASTVDVSVPSATNEQLRAAEWRANQLVVENRPIQVSFEDSAQVEGLRKASDRQGDLRIVTIANLDRSACGGTHVRSTGEIGPLSLRKTDKIRNNLRIEFLCGLRAVAQARADFDWLSEAARVFSAPLKDVPQLVAAQAEQLRESEKNRRRLAGELALRQGKEMYLAAIPRSDGYRLHVERIGEGSLGEEIRVLAQSFVAQPNAAFVAISLNPPAVLFAVSADRGIHAGNRLKEALATLGGRGGGSAQLGQGTFTSGHEDQLLADLCR